jgi:hypothetical protein
MRKPEKIYRVKNLRTGEIFTTSTTYEKDIDGEPFIGVWRDTDPHRRINWIRKGSVSKINTK